MIGSSQKKPRNNLNNYYRLFFEAGIIATLVVLLVLFKIPFQLGNKENFKPPQQETVKIKKIPQTKQNKTPPPPPAPQVPQPVPNNEVINDQPVDLNSELNVNQALKVPPPPSQKQKGSKKNKNKVFIAVQKMPQLIGGLKGLQEKISYPSLAKKAGIEGTVYVQFVVNKQGRVTDAHVIRGIGGGCDSEALRVVKEAKFKPGIQRGKPVKVRYSLPIVFRLRNQ